MVEYNAETPAQRAELLDLHIGAQWIAKVYASKVRFACDPRSSATSDLELKDTQAVGIAYLTGYDRAGRLNHLMTTNGTVYEFGCSEAKKPFLRASTVKLDQNFKRIHKVGNVVVGLTPEGNLFQIDGVKSTPLTTSLDGQIYEIAPRQSYGFFGN